MAESEWPSKTADSSRHYQTLDELLSLHHSLHINDERRLNFNAFIFVLEIKKLTIPNWIMLTCVDDSQPSGVICTIKFDKASLDAQGPTILPGDIVRIHDIQVETKGSVIEIWTALNRNYTIFEVSQIGSVISWPSECVEYSDGDKRRILEIASWANKNLDICQ